jgi:hypothetical protein
MRANLRSLQAIFATLIIAAPGLARAQDDDDDDGGGTPKPAATMTASDEDPNATHWGAGLRLRYTFIPTGLIELFVERAAGGHSHPGFGIEAIRKKGEFEIAFGLEYENLSGNRGFWIDKGESISGCPGAPCDEPDELDYDGFSWLTLDATFIWHSKIAEMVAIRYGAGLGLGIIMGDVLRSDARCTSSDIASCTVYNPRREPEADVPPVFPVVNILLGTQIRPVKNLAINIEGGMHTVFYFGSTVAYFF